MEPESSTEPCPTLLKYENPSILPDLKLGGPSTEKKGKPSQPQTDPKGSVAQLEDILESIIPPRRWKVGDQIWIQKVSTTPASRLDVIRLQEKLEQQLELRQAREVGICPIRAELYAQCFDELIRENCINCAERGLLLLRVRDELRMTIAAYQTLYESSVAFGIRKALQAEYAKSEMVERTSKLEQEMRELDLQVAKWKNKCEVNERNQAEVKMYEDKKHAEDIQYYSRANKQLKTQLEAILAPVDK